MRLLARRAACVGSVSFTWRPQDKTRLGEIADAPAREYVALNNYYTTLHCTTPHYTALHCITLHYTTLDYAAPPRPAPPSPALPRTVLHLSHDLVQSLGYAR